MRVGPISGSCCRVDFHRCLIACLTQPGKADYLQELKQLFLALKLGDVIQFVTGSAEFTQIYLVSDVVASFVSTQKEPEKQAKKFKKGVAMEVGSEYGARPQFRGSLGFAG